MRATILARRFGRSGARVLGALIGVWLLGNLIAAGDHALRTQSAAPAGWGSEAIGDLADTTPSFPFIGVANACGLGTSSCARCHDGRRALAPSGGDAAGPWHRDHARVPYSCVGCHKGNPRVMRQDVAHQKLIANPLKAPDENCKACHTGAELPALAERYLSITPSPP